jgi:chromosome segregation ATPase
MKLKNIRKKIERLEARMQKDSRRITKLKRKLNALKAAKAQERQKKAATRAVARQTASAPIPVEGKQPEIKVVKRKLNLTPERRAALAAAMKARWAAKRAAAEAVAPEPSTGQVLVVGQL